MNPPGRHIPPRGPGKRSQRQMVVALWRGFDAVPLEKAQALTAKQVDSVLPKVLSGLRMEKRQSEAEIVKVWNDLLNPQVTEHAQPTGIHKGTLFIQVDSNAWLCELTRYHRKEILERLQHSFGSHVIKRLSLKIG